MEYTYIFLFTLGLAGVMLHNLVKMDDINKKSDGNIQLGKYWAVERFSIAISAIVVGLCVLVSQEIKQLHDIGNWLGLAFASIGYMAQSLLVKYTGKADKFINDKP